MQKLETARQLQQRLSAVLTIIDQDFRPLTHEQLSRKPAPDKWSMIECLQHLNLAERFYIRNIQHKVDQLGLIQHQPADQPLESGWVGRALRWAVDPKTKMKLPAPSFIKPRQAQDLDVADVMQQFVDLQQTLHTLIDKGVYLDWNTTKLATLFGNSIRIRLGDALLMLVAHTERHINQALRAKEMLSHGE
ncbi:DinB family protein [Arsenicibacter rosenii]|uniref:DinB-like domain-containing protein n=1 Tax=Arsenicibacter rosenii TaxID=1750698 RepID=A0A1S2VQR2_9BACT|nr:DinB family protein [Arsenicibacter rosenii]OIN61102.1 hypothetical protein BLX24_03285 [Arsenicibacter rosenii]